MFTTLSARLSCNTAIVRASYRRQSCALVCCFPLSKIWECKLKLCNWSPFKRRNCKEERRDCWAYNSQSGTGGNRWGQEILGKKRKEKGFFWSLNWASSCKTSLGWGYTGKMSQARPQPPTIPCHNTKTWAWESKQWFPLPRHMDMYKQFIQ